MAVISFKEADQNGYDHLLDKIESYLEIKLSPHYTYEGKTDVAITFKYALPEGGSLKIDLLLSPYWSSREAYFRDLAAMKNCLRQVLHLHNINSALYHSHVFLGFLSVLQNIKQTSSKESIYVYVWK